MGPTLSPEPPAYKTNLKNPKKETIFILDWDDTLMCTSFLTTKIQPLSEEEQNLILNLGNIVSAFLSKCLEYGKIIILTNSSENKKTNTIEIKENNINNTKNKRNDLTLKDKNQNRIKEIANINNINNDSYVNNKNIENKCIRIII